jgi:hypothetical protein
VAFLQFTRDLPDKLRVGGDALLRRVRAEQIRLDPDALAREVILEEVERLGDRDAKVKCLAD